MIYAEIKCHVEIGKLLNTTDGSLNLKLQALRVVLVTILLGETASKFLERFDSTHSVVLKSAIRENVGNKRDRSVPRVVKRLQQRSRIGSSQIPQSLD